MTPVNGELIDDEGQLQLFGAEDNPQSDVPATHDSINTAPDPVFPGSPVHRLKRSESTSFAAGNPPGWQREILAGGQWHAHGGYMTPCT
jgi:hypothetical protein